MPVTTEELMADAKRIKNEAKEEIHYRFAAARYYYALYHRALTLANEQAAVESQPPPGSINESTHLALRSFYKHCATADESKKRLFQRLMYKLQVTHSERCAADYKLSEDFAEKRLAVHFKLCDSAFEIINEVEDLSGV